MLEGTGVPDQRPAAQAASDGSLSTLLPLTAIRLGAAAGDWRAAVRLAGAALVDSGAAAPAYTDEMIAAVEQFGPYVVIAPGIALAHSRPSPAVRHTGYAWVTLAEPVAFGHPENDPVGLVVGLAAPDEAAHIEALATLAALLGDEERRSVLLCAPDPVALRSAIEAFEREEVVAEGA